MSYQFVVAINLYEKKSEIKGLKKFDYSIYVNSDYPLYGFNYFNSGLTIPEICELIWTRLNEKFPIYHDGVKYERKI